MLLEHFYWGKLIEDNSPRGDFRIIATSPGISPQEADSYLSLVYLGSHERANLAELEHAYSFARYDNKVGIFAHTRVCRVEDRGHKFPVYHGIVVPLNIRPKLTVGLLLELSSSESTPPEFARFDGSLTHIEVPQGTKKYLDSEPRFVGSDLETIQHFFNWILSKQYSVLFDKPPRETSARLRLVQAVWDSLPSSYQTTVSFATDMFDNTTSKIKLKFLFPGGGLGRTATDIIADFGSLRLERKSNHQNWYAVWLSRVIRRDNGILGRQKSDIEENLTKVARLYPKIGIRHRLSVAAALVLFRNEINDHHLQEALVADLVGHEDLLSQDEKTRVVETLIDSAICNGTLDTWSILLTSDLVASHAEVLRTRLQSLSRERLLEVVKFGLSLDECPEQTILLSLLWSTGIKLGEALTTNLDTFKEFLAIYWNRREFRAIDQLVSAIKGKTQLIPLLAYLEQRIEDQEQLDVFVTLLMKVEVPLVKRKEWLLNLLRLTSVDITAIGEELMAASEDGIGKYTLTLDEKKLLLRADIFRKHRSTLLRELVNASIDDTDDNNKYVTIMNLLTLYTYKEYANQEVAQLLSNQLVVNFVSASEQVLRYIDRINNWAETHDEQSAELMKEFKNLSPIERSQAVDVLSELIERLEQRGMLSRNLPVVNALKKIRQSLALVSR